MWPDSSFARPISSFQEPVPVPNADPTKGPFLYVAINKAWMPYVIGSLQQLLLQTTWRTNDPATLNLAQQQAFSIIQLFQLATGDCPAGSFRTIVDGDIDVTQLCDLIRFQNGKLQVNCCNAWVDVPGQAVAGVAPAFQPGSGTPVPSSGQCQKYQGSFNANGQWVCPAVVNTGDTIQITALNGAWTDGSGQWFCPSGQVFFGGLCTFSSGVNGADPLPASPHMGLLSKIAGTYHYIGDSAIYTVPAGVSDKLLILQANLATLANGAGNITFEIQVCNNQAVQGQFTHHFDFRLSTYGTQLYTGGGTLATWQAGIGFTVTSDGVAGHNIIGVFKGNSAPLAHAAMRVLGNRTGHASASGDQIQGYNAAGTVLIEGHAIPLGTGAIDSGYIGFTNTVYSPNVQFNAGPTAGDTATLTDLYVTADGSDPF